jgi:Flp pilus assembly protein TadG
MFHSRKLHQRRGAILVLVAASIVILTGFVALAVDVGLMAVTRNQCQNAADAAAMAAARTFNGDNSINNNFSEATPNGLAAATGNFILSASITPPQVTLGLGSYNYVGNLQRFVISIPKADTDPYTLARATVTGNVPTMFGRVFGLNAFTPTATATAAHRPRDIAIIMDFSGSMRFDSLLGIPYNGARTRSNNPESVFPLFGHYAATGTAALQNTNSWTTISSTVYGAANVTVETAAGLPIVNDFFQNNQNAAPVAAFAPAADSYATTPGGDNFLRISQNTGLTYAQTLEQVTGSTARDDNFETQGYAYYTGAAFAGYTQGPRYWGKTFFIWPPDPLPANDWRRKFFFRNDGTTPLDDNTLLWDSAGNLRVPRSSSTADYYRINYAAILNWIKNTGPNPFPPQMRSGRILYYDAIPDAIDTSVTNPTDPNQRLWKEYIDYVLGVYQTSGAGSTPVYQIITQYTGYGDDFTWGTIRVSAKPTTGTPPPYMDYQDNPKRPRLHFWFGPMTMIDFLGNYNLGSITRPNWQANWWWPGTCHESPMWELKVGIQSSLDDIRINHPNDYVSTMYFAAPQNSASSPAYGRFNRTRVPLGRDYTRMKDLLWYPPSIVNNPGTELRPFDFTAMLDAPHALGGTCPAMALMLAYNQFSMNSSLVNYAPSPAPVGEAGGLGRRGAQKMIILETDGMANVPASASLTNVGALQNYYRVRMGSTNEYPANSGTVDTQVYAIVDQICALETANPGGYSTARKPVLIHCLGFGTIFESAFSGSEGAAALTLLQTIQFKGKTQASAATPLQNYKRIVGTSTERITKLQQAIQTILQDGVQVTLIE